MVGFFKSAHVLGKDVILEQCVGMFLFILAHGLFRKRLRDEGVGLIKHDCDDDDDENHGQVLLGGLHPAGELVDIAGGRVSEPDPQRDPDAGGNRVEGQKLPVGHAQNARNQIHRGARARDETGNEHDLRAVFLEVVAGAFHALFVEDLPDGFEVEDVLAVAPRNAEDGRVTRENAQHSEGGRDVGIEDGFLPAREIAGNHEYASSGMGNPTLLATRVA